MSTYEGKIEGLLQRSVDCWKRGLYEDSYKLSSKALSLCGKGVRDELVLKVMLTVARCAYLSGRFDESRKYLGAITRKYLKRDCPLDKNSVALEVAVIESNIARRSGNLSGAISILSRFDDIDLDNVRPELVAEKYLIEGAVYYYMNNPMESDRRIELAIGMASRSKDERLRARVLALMGLLAGCRGIIRAAEDYFSRASKISRDLGDLYGEASVQLNLSVMHCREGRFRRAREEAERARELFETTGWKVGVTRSCIALGNISRMEGSYDSAAGYYSMAMEMAREYGGIREAVMAREGLGDIDIEKCEFDSAERKYLENLEAGSEVGRDSELVIGTLRRLGELYLRLGEYDEAKDYLRRALRNARNLSDSLEVALAIRGLADVYFDEGKRGRAVRLYNKVFGLLRRIGADFELAKTHLFFAELISSSGANRTEATSNETASSRGDSSDGTADEALGNLLIAESIFKTIEVPGWLERTKSLINQRIKKVKSASVDFPNVVRKASVVRIYYSDNFFPYRGFAAASKAMLEVLEQARFSAGFDRPVLITGETGTGKELIARLIHGLSRRAHRAFIAVNCAAVPDHLFESEFFGHRRGCFTGALTDRKGLFEEANGGTLFLDEVGELTTLQQVKFLRVLQEGKIRRVGENRERVVDVRIISATNRNIDEEVMNKSFRDDFYFRINAERIHIPPLRERPEDIPAVILLEFFGDGKDNFSADGTDLDNRYVEIEEEALKKLQVYPWPGNVRELVTVVERIHAVSHDGVVTLDMVPERIRKWESTKVVAYSGAGRIVSSGGEPRIERIKKVLSLCNGNKTAAARWLGISRGTLYKELKRAGLFGIAPQDESTV